MGEIAIKIENERVEEAIATAAGAVLGGILFGPLGAAAGAFLGNSLARAKNEEIRRQEAERKRRMLEVWR